MITNTDRFEKAIAAFDAYHERDPNLEDFNGRTRPKELLYALRMTEQLARFAPDAGEGVQLAARCQHIGRWEIPREKYPMDKKGYLRWRNEEKIRHAKIAEGILSTCGYPAGLVEEVKVLLLKKELFTNAGTQLLEDVACLVFIEHYLEEFAAKHLEEKVIDILQKTIKKMSAKARQAAAELDLSPGIPELIIKAKAIL